MVGILPNRGFFKTTVMRTLTEKLLYSGVICLLLFGCNQHQDTNRPTRLYQESEESYEEFKEEEFEKKMAPWTEQDAANHQNWLNKLSKYAGNGSNTEALESFGALSGTWKNRGPNNMPGAFKFCEMLDGTDTIYAVSWNHYSGEYNSKSLIFKGTVYNPTSGTMGDDFVVINHDWPNQFDDLIAFKYNGRTRLIAGIQNGPVYYSDNDGGSWQLASGLPSSVLSTILNRQTGKVYTTNGSNVYVSNDGGQSFQTLQSFGSYGDATLYSPRYNVQQDADKVYLAREGVFYELNVSGTSFTQKGSYSGGHGNTRLSIAGDSRKLYVTENDNYWVSTNQGVTWTQKYPSGNWYGDRSGKMSSGFKLAASPENPDHVMGGYAQPIYSMDGLNTDNSTNSGWGNYQNGTNLNTTAYYNRIRFNYHPDFQSQQFFYNSSGDLFSAGSTDGGVFISYKVWEDHPCDNCGAYDNTGYANAHFININTLGTVCPLIYRDNLFTGYLDETHINFSTQDQGSQSIIPGTSGELLDFYQSIGGDGPPLSSADGLNVWMWDRRGKQVWAPAQLYDGSNNRRSIASTRGLINSNSSTTFPDNTTVGWVKVHIDHDQPANRIWLLARDLYRATVNGGSISGTTISKSSTYQVAAFAQAHNNPDEVYFMQEGKVYKSTNRGTSFDNGTSTPFSITSNKQNIGDGWVLPTNDDWILFAGPSGNNVGAILSKDGGNTWTDVTGNLPYGDDFQVGGMIGTPDGQYVFAGTDLGPYVFEVSTETWYPMYTGAAGMFNTTAIEYYEPTNTVRFGTWGAGVMDFTIDDNSPNLSLQQMDESYNKCDSLVVNWTTNLNTSGTLYLKKGGNTIETWNISDVSVQRFAWLISDETVLDTDYSVEIQSDGLQSSSLNFSITSSLNVYNQSDLSIDYVNSEYTPGSRFATNTIDGDESTFWHTEWSPNNPAHPHEIIYQSATSEEWTAFSYLSRQDGSQNGRIASYELYGSDDNKQTWTLLKSGTLQNSATLQTVSLDQTMLCDYVRFVALSEVNGNNWASMSEFNLYTSSSCAEDCNGDIGGIAFIDSCGVCAGGNTGETPQLDPDMCIITSVYDLNSNEFKVFPNPANEFVQLSFNNVKSITVVNSIGVVVDKIIITTENQVKLSTSNYAPGLYNIVFQINGGQQKSKPLVIK
jgi:hypothetical protein